MDSALLLQPDLSEVHLVYANHLFRTYSDCDRARVQLALSKRGLPNEAKAIFLEALMDSKEGNFEKATREFTRAITLDPRNANLVEELAFTLFVTGQFRAAEHAYDRAIDVAPDQPMLKVLKVYSFTYLMTGDVGPFRSALAALPDSLADDRVVLSVRLKMALDDRDWQYAKQLVEQMHGGEDDGDFAYARAVPVPASCYSILIARLEGKQIGSDSVLLRDETN